jgi:hypothetical protein
MMHQHLAGPWVYPDARYYYQWYHEDNLPTPEPTDGDIKAMLVERLRENPLTKDDDIRVDVKRNVAILTGDISTSLAKRAAGDDAWDTPGVRDVSNQLRVAVEFS